MNPISTVLALVVCVAVGIPGIAAASPAKGLLLVANKGAHALGIVDPESGKQIATIAEDGVTGHEVAASGDGKLAFVPIYGSGGVGGPGTDGTLMRVVDLQTRKIIHTVDFGKGVRPHLPVFEPAKGLLYVTTELDKSVTVVDPKSFRILGTVPTDQPESHMLAISRDGRRGYTSNVGPGTVSVLDLENRKCVKVIQLGTPCQRIALSVDDRWCFTSDQRKPQLAVIDTSKNEVSSWVPMAASGYGSAPTPDGRWLVIALPRANKVAAIDLHEMKVAQTVDVPKAPQEVLVRPDGAVAYVSCDSSAQVAEIDLRDWKVRRLIDAGPGADGLAWAKATSVE